jgi:hypothetical protein
MGRKTHSPAMLTAADIAALSEEWDRINAELASVAAASQSRAEAEAEQARRDLLLERLDEIEFALGEDSRARSAAQRREDTARSSPTDLLS